MLLKLFVFALFIYFFKYSIGYSSKLKNPLPAFVVREDICFGVPLPYYKTDEEFTRFILSWGFFINKLKKNYLIIINKLIINFFDFI